MENNLKGTNGEKITEAKEELKKYFSLQYDKAVMFSKFIDEVWHDLIENSPEEYNALSTSACGMIVSHVAVANHGKPTEEILWINEYENRFGKLPPIWFMDEEGNIDEDIYNEYKKSGRVIIHQNSLLGRTTCDCRFAK
ncbi:MULTISPECIES: hypothetical protein [Bacillus subtilis group]|uniref:hypothetical protein n=1 Tax=Bacillus subtilis group TaxID=653685 RepID=UPI002DBA99FF|nr:hypothetical protein [Bacillus halotolerans]MEC1600702.1 hypothetical protein [Bacillus halotolerans]